MKKKRSSKEILTEAPKDVEHIYIKYPGQELIDVTSTSTRGSFEEDREKIKKLHRKNPLKKYSYVHTHPGSPFPSFGDMLMFMKDRYAKDIIMTQRDEESGEVFGYGVLRKKAGFKYKNPPSGESEKWRMTIWQDVETGLKNLSEKYDLRYKFFPGKGYYLQKGNLWEFEFKKKKGFRKSYSSYSNHWFNCRIIFFII